ncbi:hypothetical protein TWF696_003147 [Orbilia brochopaga]|uniref:BTB domain-containing protein n=1 Tax=Orbilia brochopaga TaxID=3140254 RepID=A0AAV9U3B2_9PEZI
MRRGDPDCPSYCGSCAIDCRCSYCNYCHTCQKYNTSQHTWQHTCVAANTASVAEGHGTISSFLTETSDRFVEFFETEIFTIKVGEDPQKTFFVHKDALSNASTVLKQQVNSEMKEGQTKSITLEENPIAFSLFIQFCYFGGYGYDDAVKEDALSVHASVYVLAEKIGALGLKDLALQKATALCANAASSRSGEKSNDEKGLLKSLQFRLPDTVPIIYDGTYDEHSGKLPSTLVEGSKRKQKVVIPVTSRDGFRLLLAKFAAAHIDQLRKAELFMLMVQEYPAFGLDVLLFTNPGSPISVDDKGNLKL